jgi:hypothetical protein
MDLLILVTRLRGLLFMFDSSPLHDGFSFRGIATVMSLCCSFVWIDIDFCINLFLGWFIYVQVCLDFLCRILVFVINSELVLNYCVIATIFLNFMF